MDGALYQLNCLPAAAVNELATKSLLVYVMKATSEIGQLATGAISALPGTNSIIAITLLRLCRCVAAAGCTTFTRAA